MAAALPNYMPKSFPDAPPGHQFGIYFSAWGAGWEKPRSSASALYGMTNYSAQAHTKAQLSALQRRQQAALMLIEQQQPGSTLELPAEATSPFITGLGNEHPLENGFTFLNPYGLPALPGSGVKGAVRRAAEELAQCNWGETHGWDADAIRILFGPGEEDHTRDSAPLRGALQFWDVIPACKGDRMAVEIMTPHHGAYYNGENTPNTAANPNPITFLAVPADSKFVFRVCCDPRLGKVYLESGRWKALLQAAFDLAFDWIGFGAKTAVGYGRMQLDPAVRKKIDQARKEEEKQQKELAAAQHRASLAADQRLLATLDAELQNIPRDPRTGQPIRQAFSTSNWVNCMQALGQAEDVSTLDAPIREELAKAIKKRLTDHFRIEGKAEKELKAQLARIRGN